MTDITLTGDPFPPGTNRRHQTILRAAATVFLRSGYVGTSVDEIAALAAVSKQTVYKYFTDKEHLFVELVNATVQEISDSVHDEVLDLEDSSNLEENLVVFARRTLAKVMQPEVLQLRRLVIGEAARFPELGRTFYELGPGRTIETLAAVFAQLGQRGVLELDDPLLAAEHFNWLIMAMPLNRAMFFAGDETPSETDFDRYAHAGVKVFLAAYATHEHRRSRYDSLTQT